MMGRLDWRVRLIIALVAVALVTWAGYSAYFALRQVRHLHLAREELRKGEVVQAAFFARLVLQRNPRNPEAMKILGDLAQQNG